MPTPVEILNGLSTIANKMSLISIIWHIVFGAIILALLVGWKPTKNIAAAFLSLPLFSVCILAWIYGNPFNGMVFLVFGIALIWIGLQLPNERINIAPFWLFIPAALILAFGWVYPHFIKVESILSYFYLAPTGLIPCPTLSIVAGFALIADIFSSRLWGIVLLILVLFYALIGIIRLGVVLDVGLLFAAIILFIRIITLPKTKQD
jgi:hypothetical protein